LNAGANFKKKFLKAGQPVLNSGKGGTKLRCKPKGGDGRHKKKEKLTKGGNFISLARLKREGIVRNWRVSTPAKPTKSKTILEVSGGGVKKGGSQGL